MSDPVQAAQEVLNDGGMQLRQVLPICVREILERNAWRGRADINGKSFRDFPAFVEHRQWEGLGIRYSDLMRFCEDDEDTRRLLIEAHGGLAEQGSNQHSGGHYNVMSSLGNAATYTLRRLKRDNPALFDEVAAGNLSPNAAAIKAGFRRPVVQLAATDPNKAAVRLVERFGREWCSDLVVALDAAVRKEGD